MSHGTTRRGFGILTAVELLSNVGLEFTFFQCLKIYGVSFASLAPDENFTMGKREWRSWRNDTHSMVWIGLFMESCYLHFCRFTITNLVFKQKLEKGPLCSCQIRIIMVPFGVFSNTVMQLRSDVLS